MTSRAAEIETTRASICLATRSAVRWRVPVSTDEMLGSGIKWTLAVVMRSPWRSSRMAPSILASSYTTVGVTSTPIGMPPVTSGATCSSSAKTTSAPVLARMMLSSASRITVPGDTNCSAETNRSLVKTCFLPNETPHDVLYVRDRFQRDPGRHGVALPQLIHIAARGEHALEAVPSQLLQTDLAVRHVAHLPGKTQLPEGCL